MHLTNPMTLDTINDEKYNLKSVALDYAKKAGSIVKDKWNDSSTTTKAAIVGTGAALTAPLIIIPVLGAVGFTSAGVAAGSIAASMQTSATAAGSLFALCQSAGATGAVAASTSAAVGAGSGLTAGGIMALIFRRRRNNSNNNSQPSSTEEEPIVIDEQLNAEEHEAEEENQEQNISSDVSTENIDQLAHIN